MLLEKPSGGNRHRFVHQQCTHNLCHVDRKSDASERRINRFLQREPRNYECQTILHTERIRYYNDCLENLSNFDIYCLDKLEGLAINEDALLDRHWCDTIEIFAFLKRVAASAYIVEATQNARDLYFHEGILCEQPASNTASIVNFSLIDFLLLHWEENGFAHYDPVFDLRTMKPWTASSRCLQTLQDIHQNSNLMKAFSAGDLDLLRKIALQILRPSSSNRENELLDAQHVPINETTASNDHSEIDILKIFGYNKLELTEKQDSDSSDDIDELSEDDDDVVCSA